MSIKINHLIEHDRIIWNKNATGIFSHMLAYKALKAKDSLKPFLYSKLCLIASRHKIGQSRRRLSRTHSISFVHSAQKIQNTSSSTMHTQKNIRSCTKTKIGLLGLVTNSAQEWHFILRLTKGKSQTTEIYKSIVWATLYML